MYLTLILTTGLAFFKIILEHVLSIAQNEIYHL